MQEIKKAAVPQVARASTAATTVVAVVEVSSSCWNFAGAAAGAAPAAFDLAAAALRAAVAAVAAVVAAAALPGTAKARPEAGVGAGVVGLASGRLAAGRAPVPGRLGLTVIRAVSLGGSVLTTDVPDFFPGSGGVGADTVAAGFRGAGVTGSTGRAAAPGDGGTGLTGLAGEVAGLERGGLGAPGFMDIRGLTGLAGGAVEGFDPAVAPKVLAGEADLTAVTGADFGVDGITAFDKAPVDVAAAGLGRACVRRGGTITDVLGLSGSGATVSAGLIPENAAGDSRGGGAIMLDFFFGSSVVTTCAVPEGVVPLISELSGVPGVTVAGRAGSTGRASMRFVGGGGGGTLDVFFTSATGAGGTTASTFAGWIGKTGADFFSSTTGAGGATASIFSGEATGTPAVFRSGVTAGAACSAFGVGIGIAAGTGTADVLVRAGGGIGMVIAGIPPVVFFLSWGGCSGGATAGGIATPRLDMLPVVLVAFSGMGGASGDGGGAMGAGAAGNVVAGVGASFAWGSSLGKATGTEGDFTVGTRIGAD